MTKNLDVYVDGQMVGRLTEEGAAGVFSYLPGIDPDKLVSLPMPVRLQSYVYPRGVHPIFQMNLPEGYRKDLLREAVGPHADMSDIGLLELTGANGIGRVQVVPEGLGLASAKDVEDMASVLASADSRDSLLGLLRTDISQGVSGVMPKSFAVERVPNLREQDKVTTQTPNYILKTGSAELPWIAINEYLCLEVARHAGLEVPETRLSNDGQVLAVKRFDRSPDGSMIAFEDFCSLAGLLPVDKYNGGPSGGGSLEAVARIIKLRVPPEHQQEDMARLFTLHLVNYALKNGDAHLKNFALLYTAHNNARFAPAFDIVTVTVYPHLKRDTPALTLAGKKVWTCGKTLHEVGGKVMGLPAFVRKACLEKVEDGVQQVLPIMQEMTERFPDFRETAKLMADEWAKGLEDIKPTAKPGKTEPAPLREQIGLSGPKGAAKMEVNPYINPDGAFSHKSR